jgi:hypothetical protein
MEEADQPALLAQARSIACELWEHAINAGALPLDMLKRIYADPDLVWLRGEDDEMDDAT